MRMAFVGRYERMSAQRAYELGMISQIVDPPERLREAAQELAEKIAQNSPAAMAATKRALWGALELGLTDACRAGAARAGLDVGPPRPGRGPAAFAEKREPDWAELVGDRDPADGWRDSPSSDDAWRRACSFDDDARAADDVAGARRRASCDPGRAADSGRRRCRGAQRGGRRPGRGRSA